MNLDILMIGIRRLAGRARMLIPTVSRALILTIHQRHRRIIRRYSHLYLGLQLLSLITNAHSVPLLTL